MSSLEIDQAFSVEMPCEWRHLRVGSNVHYHEDIHLVVCIVPPKRTNPWSLVLAIEGNHSYEVTVPYGDLSLMVLRSATC